MNTRLRTPMNPQPWGDIVLIEEVKGTIEHMWRGRDHEGRIYGLDEYHPHRVGDMLPEGKVKTLKAEIAKSTERYLPGPDRWVWVTIVTPH